MKLVRGNNEMCKFIYDYKYNFIDTPFDLHEVNYKPFLLPNYLIKHVLSGRT